MSDTPKSDEFPSRFGTPVADLADHRFQPPSLPRSDASSNPPPRPRLQPETLTWANDPHPNRPRLGPRRRTVSHYPDTTPIIEVDSATVDGAFEEAVVDEEEAAAAQPRRPAITLQVPSVGPSQAQRDEPGTAVTAATRNSSNRRRRLSNERATARSIISESSSRSGSPTGSVNAFASTRVPNRPRAGTAQSVANSFITGPRSPLLQPSLFSRRPSLRPSILEDSFSLGGGGSSSGQENVEDDVCFPQAEEQTSQHFIDFDELQDFVNEYQHKPTNVPLPFTNKHGCMGHAQRTRFFHSLLNDKKIQSPPSTRSKLSRRPSVHSRRPSTQMTCDGDSSTDDEKKLDALELEQGDVIALDPILRWSFFSSEEEDTIHAAELGDLLMPGQTFKSLFALPEEGGVWWLDILMPSEEEVEAICKAFGVHGLTREDIIQQETHEKVELFQTYYFVCFRSFFQMEKTADCYLEPVNVYAVVFREGILTFTFCPSPHAANVRKRMSRLRDYVSLGSDWICYALIDDIVDSYQPVIREVELEVDSIEDNVFTARVEDTRKILKQIGECRKTVMSISRLLGGKADVIKGFAKRCTEQYLVTPRQDVGLYLSDIQDHVVTMMSNLSHFEKMLGRSHANYLAQISVNHMEQGSKANEVLSKVTFIATILVPLNLICGLFGMNVNVPGKNDGGYAWFCGIIGLMLFFVTTATIIAKRMRTLDKLSGALLYPG